MRNPNLESLSMLRLHAYAAQYRLAGVQLNRREERRQGELRRWRDEP
jgi:hypothetical protein